MRRVRGRLLATILPVGLLLSFVGGVLSVPAAHAYGNKAVWQVALSFNCNNKKLCGQELGGFWGWAEFDADNTADAELTGCGHLKGYTGAQHISAEVDGWFTAPGDTGLKDFWIESETDTLTGKDFNGPVTVHNPDPPYPSDTGIPAVAGHYSTDQVLGFEAPPGFAIQIQVVKIPNR
jgi:hypothetical protein